MTVIDEYPPQAYAHNQIALRQQNGPMLPATLPDETREFLNKFYRYVPEEGEYRAEEIVEQIVSIITAGMHTPLTSEQYDEEMRYQQAQQVASAISTLTRYIKQYELLLGFLLIYIENSALYSVLGYSNLKEFALACGATRETVEDTMKVYHLWPYLYGIGYHQPGVLIDGTFDKYKIERISRESHQQERQREQIREQQLRYQLSQLQVLSEQEQEQEEKEWTKEELQRSLRALSPEQRAAIEQETMRQYCAAAYAQVEHYRNTLTEDLIAEERKKQGKGERPLIYLTGEWRNGYFVYEKGEVKMDFAEAVGLSKNGYSVLFNGQSAKDYGNYLQTFLEPSEWD